jgi:hypothetical protein
MKATKMLAILVLVLGLAGSASADLVAHYEFEGDAHDSSGNGLHGSLVDGATIIIDADRDYVLSLDGAGGYVNCGDDPRFNITNSITVTSWIKVGAYDKNRQAIISKGNKAWSLHRRGNLNGLEFLCAGIDVSGSAWSLIQGSISVNDGQWHHVAGVYDGSKIKLYVDGILDNSEVATGSIGTSPYSVLIGENSDNPNRLWNGLIDDVRIYDNALSAAEIAELAGPSIGVESGWIISGNNMYSAVSGNVGIGTDSPEFKLEVKGDSDDPIISVTNDGSGEGVYGESFDGSGLTGMSYNGVGVTGMGAVGPGVLGLGALAPAVQGMNIISDAYGDLGHLDGVYGECPGGYAGHFDGDVKVTGRLTKGSGSFKIDHPLDPENKYLQHSFVESPDMMNIYNGAISLDEDGQATVKLPEWFEALNRDFRYQLTCIGGFAPVYIAEKISKNRFKIAGGKAGMEVSWQVTGIRRDPYANKNRVVVEENKSLQEMGYYLHPEAYGLSKEKSIETVRKPRLSQIRELAKKRMSNRYN